MAVLTDYTLLQQTRNIVADTDSVVWTDDELNYYLVASASAGTMDTANPYDAAYLAYTIAAGSAARQAAIHRAAIFQVDLSKIASQLRTQAESFRVMRNMFYTGDLTPGDTTPTTEAFHRWNTGDTKTRWDSQ